MRHIARPTIFLRDGQRFHQVPAREIGATNITDFTGSNQVVERAYGFFDRGKSVETMQLKKVDVVGAQAAQTAFYGIDKIEPGGANIVWSGSMWESRFRRDQYLIPASLNSATEHFLGPTVRVNIGRIEHSQPRLKADIDYTRRLLNVA
jgi:hypothetical protein